MVTARTDAVTILKKIKELISNSKTGFLVQEIANKLNLDRKTVIKYADALVDLGAYADDEEINNLLLICSPDFYAAAQKSADRDIVGFELDVVPELGKGKRPLIHGIPLLKRSAITGEKAILVNLKSLFVGYYGKIQVEADYKVERSAYLYVIKFWVDFKVGTINSDGKAEGIIEIKKYS